MSQAVIPAMLDRTLDGHGGFLVTGTNTGVRKRFFSCLLIESRWVILYPWIKGLPDQRFSTWISSMVRPPEP